MAINIDIPDVGTRESRLGSITGYNGDLHDLVNKSQCGGLKNRDRCFSQSSSCNAGCALGQLSGIRDIAIINHAPSGCSAIAPDVNVANAQLSAKRGVTNSTVFIGTDMN